MLNVNLTVLALIPARGGSKGVWRKNLRIVGNKCLMDYTMLAARDSGLIDRVFVSSEDSEILRYATKFGVETVNRPINIATDEASATAVVEHFIDWLPQEMTRHDPFVVYLQPTSPFRTAVHIDSALKKMTELHKATLVSVKELFPSPYKAFKIDDQGQMQSLFDERLSNCRRQDLPVTYIPNGAIYVFRISDFLERGGFPSNGSVPFVMSESDSVDIDTEEDLILAEKLLEKMHG